MDAKTEKRWLRVIISSYALLCVALIAAMLAMFLLAQPALTKSMDDLPKVGVSSPTITPGPKPLRTSDEAREKIGPLEKKAGDIPKDLPGQSDSRSWSSEPLIQRQDATKELN